MTTEHSHFRIIEHSIDTAPFIEELQRNNSLWQMVAMLDNIGGDKTPYGFLPLVMGVQYGSQCIKDSEYQQDTLARRYFPVLNQWLVNHGVQNHSRAAFFKLPPGGRVHSHIDDGKYYLTRDRYHFSLQGEYEYTVGDETKLILPGTFFWFDNKVHHSAHSVGNDDRITFVFDVSHSPMNP